MRKWLVTGLVAVLAITAAGVLVATAGWFQSSEAEWPDEIAPIADEVEQIRGLQFDHPVPVRFLSDAEFDERLGGRRAADDVQLQESVREAARALTALGMLPTDYDLAQAVAEVGTSGVAGRSTATEVLIRGSELDVETAPVVAHELTHILQSQNFDPPRVTDGVSATAIDGLREGEASWVAAEYVDRLPRRLREQTTDVLTRQAAEAQNALLRSDAPEVFPLIALAPYTFGEQLVRATVADGGLRALDALWDARSRDDTSLIDVLRDPATTRPLFRAGEGTEGDRSGFRLGAIGFFYMLASHLNPVTALDAAMLWRADDATMEGTDDGRECIHLRFVANGTSRGALITALREWMHAAGGDGAFGRDQYLDTYRCTDEPMAPISPGTLQTATNVAAFRNRLAIRGLERGFSRRETACIASNYLVDLATLVEMLRPRLAEDPPPRDLYGPEMENRRVVAAQRCDLKLPRRDWADPTLVG